MLVAQFTGHFKCSGVKGRILLFIKCGQAGKRIFYTGPSFLVQDVQWVNDSVILLAGAMPYDPDMVIPQIHRIFLAEGIHEIYEIRDPAPVNFNEYHQEIIKTKLDGRKKEF